MNKILVMLKGIIYRIIGLEWISAPKCNPVPVYIVEDARVRTIHRGIRVKDAELCGECGCQIKVNGFCMMGHYCGDSDES